MADAAVLARNREALVDLKITPCIPGRKNRKASIPYDAGLHEQRNRIERRFGRRKNWRRIATRYDRPASNLLAAPALVAIVSEWT